MDQNYTESVPLRKERPILFSGPMVRAILDGRKTQTRRIIKPGRGLWESDGGEMRPIPQHKPGDRLWVRESLRFDEEDYLSYAADLSRVMTAPPSNYKITRNSIPSIFMPRWASRITLDVTSVKVEHLQDIREKDAKAEGAPFVCASCGNDLDTVDGAEAHWACEDPDNEGASHKEGFRRLWDQINGKRAPWSSNPWVTATTFERVMA